MQNTSLAGLAILIVEDEALLRKQLSALLERAGADVTGAGTLQAARQVIGELSFDFALLDVNLPDGVSLDLLRDKTFPAGTGVIVMTAHGGVSGAVDAMRLGALDYLVKPFDPAELPLVLARAQRARQSARAVEHRRSGDAQSVQWFFFGSALAPLEAHLNKILQADERMREELPPVLIEGETGTGKSTIARWLHHHGPRKDQPLIEVNCPALPETLAESELFGHERGAFTDARSARMGLFEAADGGSLFLDELPSLSPALQSKVLTAIEGRKVRRVGGNKEITVDVRIIAASNRDLKAAIQSGEFREDLYQRLDLYRIHIPPLRERRQDLFDLAQNLLANICRRHRLPKRDISPAGRERLWHYDWPGNVRELAHELERAVVFEEGGPLNFDRLSGSPATPGASPNDWFDESFVFAPEGFQLENAINRLIRHALRQSGNNVSAAARLLGVSRDYVRYRLAGGKQEKSPAGNEDC